MHACVNARLCLIALTFLTGQQLFEHYTDLGLISLSLHPDNSVKLVFVFFHFKILTTGDETYSWLSGPKIFRQQLKGKKQKTIGF